MAITQATPSMSGRRMPGVNPIKLFSFSLLFAGCFQMALGIGSIAAPAAKALAIELTIGFVMLPGVFFEAVFA